MVMPQGKQLENRCTKKGDYTWWRRSVVDSLQDSSNRCPTKQSMEDRLRNAAETHKWNDSLSFLLVLKWLKCKKF